MIEASMYLGIGLLFGALIGLVLIPLVHARAVRLTARRLEAVLPESRDAKELVSSFFDFARAVDESHVPSADLPSKVADA